MKVPYRRTYLPFFLMILALGGLYAASIYNYDLFLSLASLFSIVIALGIFILVWTSRNHLDNNYLLFIGIAYLFLGGLQMAHTLALQSVYGYGDNTAAHLWVATRYVESLTFLAAPLFIAHKLRPRSIFLAYAVITPVLLMTVVLWNLSPAANAAGSSKALFTDTSQYIIAMIFASAILLLLQKRQHFNPGVLRLLITAMVITASVGVVSAIVKTNGEAVHMAEHLAQLVSLGFIFQAVVDAGLTRPYQLILKDLGQNREALRYERDTAQKYLDVAGVIFVAADANGKVTLINKKGCEVLGYQEDEIIGKDWLDNFIPPRLREESKSVTRRLLTGEVEATEYYENPVLTRSGEERIIAWHNVLLKDEADNIIGHLSSGEDITERQRTEAALKESEEELRRMFSSVTDGIVVTNLDGIITDANEKAIQMYGCNTARELVGANSLKLVEPTDLPKVMTDMKDVLETGADTGIEYVVTRIDGSRFPSEASTSILKDVSGNPTGFISVIRDISEQKQAEEKLQESEARYRALFETKLDGTIVIDETMKIVLANQAVADMFGFESIEELYEINLLDYVMPEFQEWAVEHITVGIFQEDRRGLYEIRCMRKNGEEIWVSATGIRTEYNGKPIGIISLRDITDRKRMAEAIAKSAQRYRSLFENMPAGFVYGKIITDENDKPVDALCLEVNDAIEGLTGIKKEQLIGKRFSEIMPTMAESNTDLFDVLGEAAATGESASFENYFKPLGKWVASSIYSPEKGYFTAMFEDITERKQTEEIFRTVSLRSPAGMYIVQDGKFVFANPRFFENEGITEEELLGTYPLDRVHPEDRELVRQNAIAMLKGERTTPYEYRIVNEKGEVDAWFSETVVSIQYQGKRAVLGNAVDITEQKQAEEIFRTISMSSPASIYIAQDGKFVFTNPRLRNRINYTEEGLSSMEPKDLIHPEDREMARQSAVAMLKGEHTTPFEYRSFTNTGEMLWVAETDASIQYQGRRAVLGSILDITERKQAEEQILHLNLVLSAIRNVNQLITREKDRGKLIKGVCNTLVETRGYYNTWIALLDESGKLVTYGEAGLGKDCLPMIEKLKRGELTTCARRAQVQSEVVFTENPSSSCVDCPLAKTYGDRGALTIRLEVGGKIYGFLSASIPIDFISSEEEVTLFKEVAQDITLALQNIGFAEEHQQAEKEIASQRKRLKDIMENMVDGVTITDMNGRITDINRAATEQLGYTRDEAIGKTPAEICLVREEIPRFVEAVTTIASGRTVKTQDFTSKCKNGRTFPTSVNLSLVKDVEGKPEAIIAVHRDITERKRMEETLRRSEESFRAITESARQAIITIDAQTRIVLWNKAAEDIYGYSADEAIGQPFTLILPERLHQAFQDEIEAMLSSQTPNPPSGLVEAIRLKKDGNEFPVGTTLARWQAGEETFFTYISRDITLQKQAEERLQESELRYRQLVETSPDMIITADLKGNLLFVNKEWKKYHGYSDREIKRINAFSILHPDDVRAVKAAFTRVMRGHSVANIECRTINKNGSYLNILANLSPILNPQDKVTSVLIASMDITDRKQAEEIFRTISINSPASIYILQDGKFVFTNTQFLNTAGYSQDEILNTDPQDLIHPEDREMVRHSAITMLKGEHTTPYEYRALNKNGEIIWVTETIASIQYQGRQAILGSALNNTERKQAEEIFRTVSLSSPAGMYIVQDGKFIFANPQFASDVGWTEDELLGADALDSVRPEDTEMVRRNAIEMLKGIRTTPYEYGITNSAGETRWLMETVAPIQYQGKRAVLGNVLDITERKKTEERLRETRRRFRDLVNLLPLSVTEMDADSNITFANKKAIDDSGYTEREVNAAPIKAGDTFAPKDRERVQENIRRIMNGEQLSGVEYTFMRNDGSTYPVITYSAPIIQDGKAVGLRTVTIDVTELKQAEQEIAEKNRELEEANAQLQEVDRLKSIFLSSMSHELRTPLNSIIGFTSLILDGMTGDINEEQKEQLTLVKGSSHHLLSLINDVLDISKIEAGRVELTLEEFPLNELVSEVASILTPTAQAKSIELTAETDGDIQVYTDRRRFKQVLINLTGNAVKFTEQGSVRIIAGLHKEKGHIQDDILEVHIIDTGIGIKKEDIDKLFAPFQQVDGSLTRRFEGTGLGLHHSKKILTMLGGDVWIKSKYGKGSDFGLTLPLKYRGGENNEENTGGG